MNRPVVIPAAVDYPCSDGQPMAESDFQLKPLVYAITALQTHFLHQSQVYVAGDMFLYFKEGAPRAVVAPDVFVVVGAPKHKRMSYKLWEEPKAPDFVLEITSRSTRKEDQGRNREVYASLGVGEYWLFDPTGDYLAPRLQGFSLHAGEYRPLASSRSRESETDKTAEFEIPRVRVGLNVVIGQHQIAQQPGPRHRQAHSSPLGTAVDTPVHVRFCSSQPRVGDGHVHEDCATRSEQIRARDDNAGEVNDNSVETVRRSRLDGPLARFTPAAQTPRSRRLGEHRFESRGAGRCGPVGAGPWLPSRTARRCTGGRPPRMTWAHR